MNKRIALLLVLLLCILLVSVSVVSAKAEKVAYTATSYTLGPPLNMECRERGHTQLCRNAILRTWTAASDPRLTGEEMVTIHWNFHQVPGPVYWTGPWWGTTQLVNDGGSWEFTFTGERDDQGHGHLHGVGHGRGGYEGLKVFITGYRPSSDEAEPFDITGYILEP